MRLPRWQILLARLVFLIYVLFSATYCLLAYIPFTYQQVHVGELLPWLTRLVHWHAWLFWPAWALAVVTILPDLQAGSARHVARIFVGAGVIAGTAVLIHPLLPNLINDASSLNWCLIWLVPLLWLVLIDWLQGRSTLVWRRAGEDDSSRIFFTAFQSAVYLAAVYFVIVILRVWSSRNLEFSILRWTWMLFWSLISHLLLFFLLFVVFDLVSALCGLFSGETTRSKAATLGSCVAVGALIGLAVRYIVLPPLSIPPLAANVVAAALAFALVIYAIGTSVRVSYPERGPIEYGLDLLLVPFNGLKEANWAIQGLSLIGLAAVAWVLAIRTSQLDWEFLLQKITVMIVWTLAFAIFYAITPSVSRFGRVLAYVSGAVFLAGYVWLVTTQPRRNAETGATTVMGKALDEFEGYDISFRLADEMLRPQLNPQTTADSAAFYSFLAENTNIPRSTHISPVDIQLVGQLSATSSRKPHIFVLVIDSLRRDYLSAYNPDVTFTPAIDAFARDSVVFQNAFTHYGGTGLSEPSIWVGGLIPHQQYVTPFAPMNSLQKLIDINQYQEWVSKDNVLQQVIGPAPNLIELDANIGAMHYDLCSTLQEVERRLSPGAENLPPTFVYTQAQNIHVSVIAREGQSVPEGVSFPPPFDSAYAWRVQTMDTCLGGFFESLKKSGAYDNSLIVITSDHGDSLGEQGRWGHAYTLFPEIVRIPLIVHLPVWWRETAKGDPQAVAFLTDLTPTLYYLLEQKPLINNQLFGRPLFTTTIGEQTPYFRSSYLLASSYAPVYGLLSDRGRSLYIADGVNFRDYAYELDPDGTSREAPLSDSQRAYAQSQIREQVEAIAKFYRIH